VLPGCVPLRSELSARYEQQGYWTGERLGDLLAHWAEADPGRIALVTETARWTYAELAARSRRVAGGFQRLGVAPRDRVVVQLTNSPEFVIVSFALFQVGAIPVYALPAHRQKEIAELVALTDAVGYVVPGTFQGFDYRALAAEVAAGAPGLRHVVVAGDAGPFVGLDALDDPDAELVRPDPAEVAFFLLSGGTTGTPKLIGRTHRDYALQLRTTAGAVGVDERAVYLAAVPAAHNAALGCPGVLGTLRVGGKVVLGQTASPDDVFGLIEREGVTHTTLMPPVVTLWLEMAPLFGADLSGLVLQVGGAMLNPDVAQAVITDLGCRLTHWFGMAEGPLCYTRLDDPPDVAVATQGRPLLAADEIRIVDDADADVAPGEAGELLYRGPTTIAGYYRAPDHNARAFTTDGFLRTGDLARTVDGNLVIVGRVKDIINRGGEKVSAEEVESHLLDHPAVRGVAVVAIPDRLMGEKTCAVVTPAGDPPALTDLRHFLQARGLADYKLPDRLWLVESFPHTNVGKIDKRALRALVTSSAYPGGTTPPDPPVGA
jgi:2,3-dihydroxybenzoate-AMP ligase